MKASNFKYLLLSRTAGAAMLIIALMPFHAFLTIWLSTLTGHYTLLRLWKEILLVILAAVAVYLLIFDQKIRGQTLTRRLVQLTLLFMGLQLVNGLVAYGLHRVSLKALGYGLIVNNRFLVFFLVTWALSSRNNMLRDHWRKLLFWPAVVVVVFGVLQATLLPYNFLAHFGYGPHTIQAYQTINQNKHYIRIESTLRGSNPLGAYLMLIGVFVMAALVIKRRLDKWKILLLAGILFCLYFSYSRSAWLGLILAVALLLWVYLGKLNISARKLWLGGAASIVVLVILAAGLHNNARFQNIFLHTQSHSTVAPTTSDQGHLWALESGLKDIIHQPLGDGVGSAGPASEYNHDRPARFPEDYYLQTGQETGAPGLLLLVVIIAGVGYLLWLKREDQLALSLFVSLAGICLINLLLPAWSDDTLAYIWWGLAGVAMVPRYGPRRN